MPRYITRHENVLVSHRMNFWGRPTSASTISWEYKGGQPVTVKRPDDGEPPSRRSVRCEVCKKTLTYTVHSVRATRRRQARRRVLAYAGLVLFLVGAVATFTSFQSENPVRIVLSPVAFIVGAALGWSSGLAAAEEIGISGHGASWPGATKHSVAVIESRPEDMPELVCPRCGHQEDSPWGSDYRKSWLEREYQAAKERFERHACRRR